MAAHNVPLAQRALIRSLLFPCVTTAFAKLVPALAVAGRHHATCANVTCLLGLHHITTETSCTTQSSTACAKGSDNDKTTGLPTCLCVRVVWAWCRAHESCPGGAQHGPQLRRDARSAPRFSSPSPLVSLLLHPR
eukprot:scaffold248419_cov28-Tisochrysis_lutea.AAC.7